jgi:hypothetical protein
MREIARASWFGRLSTRGIDHTNEGVKAYVWRTWFATKIPELSACHSKYVTAVSLGPSTLYRTPEEIYYAANAGQPLAMAA